MRRPITDWLNAPLEPQAEFDLAPDATGLPFAAEGERHRGQAVGCFLLAVILGILGALVVLAWVAGSAHPLSAVVLASLTALAALWAAYQWSRRQRWEFTRTDVTCSTRSVLTRRHWQEPLSAYRGVVSITTVQSFHLGEGRRDRHKHILVLEHGTNLGRSVKLYGSRSPEAVWARQTHYGRLFGLPGLIQTSAGIVVRHTEELGKSVRQRVAEGRLRVSFDPSTQPTDGLLQVRLEEGTLVLEAGKRTRGAMGRLFPPALMATGALTTVLGLILGPWSHSVLTWIGTAQMALGTATLLAFWVAPEELAVSTEGVCRRRRHPWGTFGELKIPADSIEEVTVREPLGEGKKAVVQVISRAATIRFGALLSEEEKNWVRDCIIAVISK